MSEQHHYIADNVARIVGLALMVLAVGWMAFSVLFGLGLAIAWISETGLTEELQPWVISVLVVGALSAAVGYGVFFLGRRLRQSR
jgi:hypothetical protein